MKTIRVLLADDHLLILKGIRSTLQSLEYIDIIGEATNGLEAVDLALKNEPDVLFLDITMPELSGIEACKQIHSKNQTIKIIALSQHDDEAYVLEFMGVGGSGYMLKNSTQNEFIMAIESVMKDNTYYSPQLSNNLINDRINKNVTEFHSPSKRPHLTAREIEIIKLISDGFSSPQIGSQLHISLWTVETHRRNIMQKLKINNVVSLVKYAVNIGLVDLKTN